MVFTLANVQEDTGPRIDAWTLTKVHTRRIKKKYPLLRQLVMVCWSCNADSRFFGHSKFLLKQMKKYIVFFWRVRGNDTQIEMPLISLKSQESSIKNFWKLIQIVVWEVNWLLKVKLFVYFDSKKKMLHKKIFYFFFSTHLLLVIIFLSFCAFY